jgi:hypothetical protein
VWDGKQARKGDGRVDGLMESRDFDENDYRILFLVIYCRIKEFKTEVNVEKEDKFSMK